MDILAKGTVPASGWESLPVIEPNVSVATLASYFAAGRQQDDNYNILVKDSATIGYWYPKPIPVPPPLIPRTLSKTAFMDICEIALGGNGVGRARFGAIIRACSTSADDEVRFVYERFQGAQTFDKQVVLNLMTLLISKGTALINPPVTASERAAINTNWPNQ